jgi:hypothetical protein
LIKFFRGQWLFLHKSGVWRKLRHKARRVGRKHVLLLVVEEMGSI